MLKEQRLDIKADLFRDKQTPSAIYHPTTAVYQASQNICEGMTASDRTKLATYRMKKYVRYFPISEVDNMFMYPRNIE